MNVAGFFNPRLRHCLITGSNVPAWLIKHPRYSYVRQAIFSQPDWVDKPALHRIHEYKRLLTIATGIEHVADHIVPLNHPDVCGLTVPWNLQLMTRKQNGAKSNKWNPNQLELAFSA